MVLAWLGGETAVGTLGRTWKLYKQSFAVLGADTEILLFPVMSAVSAVLVAAAFFFPLYFSGTLLAIKDGAGGWADYAVLFVWYYLNYFVVIFFNSALVACANIRLSGGNPTVAEGLRVAMSRITRIAAWAFVAATVGIVLSWLRDRGNRLVRLLSSGLAVGWALITYLIIPVIIIENRNVSDGMLRSSELFRKHWGEQVAGSFGFGLLNLLLLVPGLLLGWLVYPYDLGAAIILTMVYILLLAAVSSAVKGIFTVALYRFATDGVAPYGFDADSIDPNWRYHRRLNDPGRSS